MATDWFLVSASPGAGAGLATASTTWYLAPDCPASLFSTTEGSNSAFDSQWSSDDTYTASKLWARIPTNTRTTTGTLRTRKNRANGGQSATIAGSTTGTITDASNTDSLVANDEYNYSFTTGTGSGTTTIVSVTSILNHSATTGPQIMHGGATGTGSITATANRFTPMNGGLTSAAVNATEASNVERTYESSSTQQATARVYVSASTTTQSISVRPRKNRASSANLQFSITAGTTGIFSDTSGSDSFAAGDETDWLFGFKASEAGNVTINMVTLEIDGVMLRMAISSASGQAYSNTTAQYSALCGQLSEQSSTESNAQAVIPTTGIQFKNLFAYVSANTRNGSSTISLRKNGADDISISVGSSTTGILEETSTVSSPTTNDTVNYMVQAGGSSGTMTVRTVSVEQGAFSINQTVTSVVAAATAAANVPAVNYSGSVAAVVAAATADAKNPSPNVAVNALVSQAIADALAPAVTATGAPQNVTSVAASASASANAPSPNVAEASVAASATASATSPSPNIGEESVAATASAAANAPALNRSGSIASMAATSSADAKSPSPNVGVAATAATATAAAASPGISQSMSSQPATATASARIPGLSNAVISAAATATGEALSPEFVVIQIAVIARYAPIAEANATYAPTASGDGRFASSSEADARHAPTVAAVAVFAPTASGVALQSSTIETAQHAPIAEGQAVYG